MDLRGGHFRVDRRFTVSLLIISLLLILASCNLDTGKDRSPNDLGDTGISVYTEMIKVDLEYGSETLGFPLYFVSDRKLSTDEITFVRLEGENVAYFSETTLNNNQIPDVTDIKINGSYLYSYNVDSNIDIDYFATMTNSAQPEIWDIRIDAVVVSISGKEYSIALEYPVVYHYNDEGYNDLEGIHMYGPFVVFSSNLSEAYYATLHNYANSIVLKDLYFSNFLIANSTQVYYGSELLGTLDGTQALNIQQRARDSASGALLYFTPSHDVSFARSDFDYILCTLIAEYQIEGDETIYHMRFPFNTQGIGDRKTAEAFLAYIASMEDTPS